MLHPIQLGAFERALPSAGGRSVHEGRGTCQSGCHCSRAALTCPCRHTCGVRRCGTLPQAVAWTLVSSPCMTYPDIASSSSSACMKWPEDSPGHQVAVGRRWAVATASSSFSSPPVPSWCILGVNKEPCSLQQYTALFCLMPCAGCTPRCMHRTTR